MGNEPVGATSVHDLVLGSLRANEEMKNDTHIDTEKGSGLPDGEATASWKLSKFVIYS